MSLFFWVSKVSFRSLLRRKWVSFGSLFQNSGVSLRIGSSAISSAALQHSSSVAQGHGNPAGQKLKKRAVQQQLGSPAAWQLSRKETTAQHLRRRSNRYYRILTDAVSLVFLFQSNVLAAVESCAEARKINDLTVQAVP